MWLIIVQSCEDPRAVGWTSFDLKPGHLARLKHRFRLLTDDGDICVEGIGDADHYTTDVWDEACLDPLLNFGMGRYGCNRIQYWCRGGWEGV